MRLNSNKIKELREKIRAEEIGLKYTRRALGDLTEGTSLHDSFSKQALRIEARLADFKAKLPRKSSRKEKRRKR